ncbi:MAG: LPS-assembly protein LptD [Lentisphaeria bacterium]|nr:LPS-assembly protein LptD [Lentisphaeria bacterium]
MFRYCKNCAGVIAVLLCICAVQLCSAAAIGRKSFLSELKSIRADKWTWNANNVILEGNVVVPSKNFHIVADKVILNTESRDIECSGNIKLLARKIEKCALSNEQFAELRKYPDVVVEVEDSAFTPLGEPYINTLVYYVTDTLTADKLAGNLTSGYLSMQNVRCKSGNFALKAESAVRKANGDIDLQNADFSSCEYLVEDNAHYSISASEINLRTYQDNGFDIKNYDFSIGQHSVYAKNAFVNIYGVPVLWLPVFYKPKDESPQLFDFSIGATSDWGFFVSLSKEINISEYPYAVANLMVDYYEKRGFGYGTEVNFATENSKTNLFAYGIYDTHPNEGVDLDNSRMRIPHFRFDLRLTNVSHITPTFDFRTHVEYLSDPYVQYDFFRVNYNNNPEPASYAALEKYFENVTFSLYSRVRVNNFSNTVQKLPEFRIDVPRMEIFNTNLYYQGEHSIDYLSMKWRDFDKPRTTPNYIGTADYETMRLDSVNFLYYPIKLFNINIIPRAGVRFTVYSDSSKRKVYENDLQQIFIANEIEGAFPADVVNYDRSGGARARFIGEFGFEANTKIHRTYNDVRSEFFGIDGLKHVMVPYVNYTYITEPTEDREHLYYFDDVDRIERQNFFRLGLENRFFTRADNMLVNTFRMENYLDLHIDDKDGFNHVGDFCTRLSTSPLKGLELSTLFAINAGDNYKDREKTYRNGRMVSRKGFSGRWLNRWQITLRYEPIEDFVFSASYVYRDNYASRSAYSMGSTLTDMESGSAFDKYYNGRTQLLTLGVAVPLTPDRRTKASYQFMYDFEAGFIRSQRIGVSHKFHCWEFAVILAQSTDYEDGDKERDYSIYFNATLNGVRNPLQQIRGEMPGLYRRQAMSTSVGGF